MYLSRLILNPRNRKVQIDLSNFSELHRTVLSGFSQGRVRIERSASDAVGVLFRLDSNGVRALLTLVVQSQTRPDWTSLPPNYLLPPDPYDPTTENPALKAFEPQFRSQQLLRFRLRANPTKRLSRSLPRGMDKSKRVGLYKLDEQLEWLARKGNQHGFRLLQATATGEERADDPRRNLKFLSVQFDGILQVVDPEALASAVSAGIGSGKAFGFGLLSLAPAR